MKFSCNHCGGITEIGLIEEEYVGCGHCDQVLEVPKHRFDKNMVIAGDFVILEQIGIGGMGLVYKAHQVSLERIVALKVLKESFCQNTKFIENFISEARAAAQLRHPNIVQAYAVGHDEGAFYIAMELVEGPTTANMLLDNYKFNEKEILKIATEISEALDYAWNSSQLLHRDIKPDNIMIDQNGKAMLMDLGLACNYTESVNEEDDVVLGTPQYISPEQLTGAMMDFRGDQYSLGATLYHLATNQYPFDGEDASQIAMKHLTDEVIPPKEINPSLSSSFSNLICKMMAKSPDDRFNKCSDLTAELMNCMQIRSKKTLKSSRPVSSKRNKSSNRDTQKKVEKDIIKQDNTKYLKFAAIGVFILFGIISLILLFK